MSISPGLARHISRDRSSEIEPGQRGTTMAKTLSKINRKWLEPILQPRFAMGIAMTILSFSMFLRLSAIRVQCVHPVDFHPAAMWDVAKDRAMRVRDEAVKCYENLRLIYRLERRIKHAPEQESTEHQPKILPPVRYATTAPFDPTYALAASSAWRRKGPINNRPQVWQPAPQVTHRRTIV
jgi:hypothetical protein